MKCTPSGDDLLTNPGALRHLGELCPDPRERLLAMSRAGHASSGTWSANSSN
ncbi:hypothetical protein ABZT02_10890 [Streptomyces sp. NPDC005402]|uniref:hypothetical protein n=1 Tax=Streptomyces sp. NPDC005402 TaxID=3155338 RepID=UPI0033AFF8E8